MKCKQCGSPCYELECTDCRSCGDCGCSCYEMKESEESEE